jgi:hypothetical protein
MKTASWTRMNSRKPQPHSEAEAEVDLAAAGADQVATALLVRNGLSSLNHILVESESRAGSSPFCRLGLFGGQRNPQFVDGEIPHLSCQPMPNAL